MDPSTALGMTMVGTRGRDARDTDYRRHSALRTIRGGICWGGMFLCARLEQLLVLGCQRMVKISGFMGQCLFLLLPHITGPISNKRSTPSSIGQKDSGLKLLDK